LEERATAGDRCLWDLWHIGHPKRRGEGIPTLRFRNLQEIYKYDKSVRTPDLPQVVKAPKDMVGWFQHHPYLDTEKPEPATVGGVKGVQFDYIVREDTPSDEINLFRYADGSVGGWEGVQVPGDRLGGGEG
jgi:hypothetical protein